MAKAQNWTRFIAPAVVAALAAAPAALASEADLQLPPIDEKIVFSVFGKPIMGATLMWGGIVVAVHEALDVPVKFVGVGEQVGDLEPFNAALFARELVEA